MNVPEIVLSLFPVAASQSTGGREIASPSLILDGIGLEVVMMYWPERLNAAEVIQSPESSIQTISPSEVLLPIAGIEPSE